MSEQEKKQPGEAQEAQVGEVSVDDLNRKMQELGELEKKLFGGDGKIGERSDDTQIDAEYLKGIETAKNIQQKIHLVENLISKVSLNKNLYDKLHNVFDNHIVNKYLNVDAKESYEKYKKEVYGFILLYPQFSDNITYYIQGLLYGLKYNIEFYEDDFRKNNNQESLNAIFLMSNGFFQMYSNDILNIKEDTIKILSDNTLGGNKQKLINQMLEKGVSLKTLDKIIKLDFYKDSFDAKKEEDSDFYGEDGVHNIYTNALQGLCFIGYNSLQELNKIYISNNPDKNALIVKYIDENFSVTDKDKLFDSVGNIKKIYVEYNRQKIHMEGIILKDSLIIDLFNIKGERDVVFKISLLMDNIFRSNQGYEELKKFIETDFGNILYNMSPVNKIYFSRLLREITDELYDIYAGKGIKKDFKVLFESLNETNKYVEKEVQDKNYTTFQVLHQAGLIQKNAQTLLSRGIITINNDQFELSRDSTNPPQNIYIALENISKQSSNSNLSSQDISHTSPESLPSSPKIESLNKKAQQAGVGDKFAVDSNGRLVSRDYYEQKQQAIARGEAIPPEDNSTSIERYGRNGQIEFGRNNEIVFTSSLGYKFELPNTIDSLPKIFEIKETFDYLDRIGLGYFGDNFSSMIDTMRHYLPNKVGYLRIDEQQGNFFSKKELGEVILPIFQNIGFIEVGQNLDYFAPEEITDTVMGYRVGNIEGAEMCLKGKSFDKKIFGELLQQTNTV